MESARHYSELHCISNFTFLRGASHPQELVRRAAELGYQAIALTDECSLAGVVRAHTEAKTLGIQLIIGSEIRFSDTTRMVLLATNREGYAQLSALITTGRRRADKGNYLLHIDDLSAGLADCLAIYLPQQNDNPEILNQLTPLFRKRLWIAVEHLHEPGDQERIHTLKKLAKKYSLPLVACGDVHMHRKQRRALQDTLTAVRLNTFIADTGYALHRNGERYLRPGEILQQLYEPEWLEETGKIAALCHFSLDELRYEYPAELVPPGETAASHLRKLTKAGMQKRWPQGVNEKVRQQIEHELVLISELRYEHFFLTVHDIVCFARSNGILCQGRGSAANSAVCYCLEITAVDPARSSMLFERFISRERNEPPDIDVDFENARREEVMQYIYRKYGRHRAALAATVITYRRKSALRDVGKILGLTQDQIERLLGTLAWWDNGIPAERLREAGFTTDNPVIKKLLYLVDELQGFPRHLSQHVGGFVIARDDLSRLVPSENAAMAERTVIQWDKEDLEALGLLKVDCLALGMLSALHRSFDLLRQHYGLNYDLATIPADDPAVYNMIQKADTIGVFQIESRAQMNMLPRLKPENFYDLVIEIAIVRPGPIQGDMVHPYLKRRRGEEPITYPNTAVKKVLERTLGVPIFQEQVIELAMVAAGFSAGEADQLRRAITAWRQDGKLEHFRQRLLEGMLQRGFSAEYADRIYEQIRGFGGYGFPESHSASFALLAWVSCWLKHYYPEVFTCALLNSQPMGFYPPSQLIQDLRRHEREIRPVDIMHSDWESTLESLDKKKGKVALRLGMHLVKGLSREAAERICTVRAKQSFSTLQSLQQQVRLNRRDLDALAAADALRSLSGHRYQARWDTLGCEVQDDLLKTAFDKEHSVSLSAPDEGASIVADYETLGLSLRRHPLALLRPRFENYGWLTANEVQKHANGSHVNTIGLVTSRQRPGSASGTIFITLEDESGYTNIVVWPRVNEKFRKEVLQSALLMVSGKIERDGQVVHLIANHLQDQSQWLGNLSTQSRDFH